MIKAGILCAADMELEPFLPHIENRKISEKAMLRFHEGTICGVDAVALFCGVCKTNAAVATQILIDTYGVNVVVNAGTAGGIRGDADIFDTVISTEVAHHDMDQRILTEYHPWMQSVYFKADEALIELAKKAVERLPLKNKVLFGRTVTGEKFIDDASRPQISLAYEPISVDMETASIAQACYVNGIPFIAIRSITDNAAHDGAENFEKNCALASALSKDIVLELLKEMKQSC